MTIRAQNKQKPILLVGGALRPSKCGRASNQETFFNTTGPRLPISKLHFLIASAAPLPFLFLPSSTFCLDFLLPFFPSSITTMLAHSLLSGALLLLPVAVTLGIYIGVNVQQIFHSGFKGSYGIPNFLPKFGTNTYCQKSIGITPQNGRYTCELCSCSSCPSPPTR
jgi:hypothetical protein